MFGSIDKSKGILFVTHDLQQSLQNAAGRLPQEVEGLDENTLLNTAPDDLKRYRYVLHSNGDTNRETVLTALVFHVPN